MYLVSGPCRGLGQQFFLWRCLASRGISLLAVEYSTLRLNCHVLPTPATTSRVQIILRRTWKYFRQELGLCKSSLYLQQSSWEQRNDSLSCSLMLQLMFLTKEWNIFLYLKPAKSSQTMTRKRLTRTNWQGHGNYWSLGALNFIDNYYFISKEIWNSLNWNDYSQVGKVMNNQETIPVTPRSGWKLIKPSDGHYKEASQGCWLVLGGSCKFILHIVIHWHKTSQKKFPRHQTVIVLSDRRSVIVYSVELTIQQVTPAFTEPLNLFPLSVF